MTRPPLLALATMGLLLACGQPLVRLHSPPLPPSDPCNLPAWAAANASRLPAGIVLRDSLDTGFVANYPQHLPKPLAYPTAAEHGYDATFAVVLVVDSTGHIQSSEIVNGTVWAWSSAVDTPDSSLRAEFVRSVHRMVGPVTYSTPMYHHRPVTALICEPVTFRGG